MRFITINAIALAAVAYAMPAEMDVRAENAVEISLPPGCSKGQLTKCALHLVGTTAACGAAIIELGANPAADLSCIGSAASTAAKYKECEKCIPHKTLVVEK